MGASQRRKGATGQRIAANMLRDRDWQVDQITAGIKSEDLIATGPDGRRWSCEVKNCATMNQAQRKQAMEQARKRKLPWMLMRKIAGSSSWLVERQGERPAVWHEAICDETPLQGSIG